MSEENNQNNIISLNDYEGTHIAKSFVNPNAETPKMTLEEEVNAIAKSCNAGFENGKTTEEELEKAFDQLEEKLGAHLEKSESNQTFERDGELGEYSYSIVEKSAKKSEEMKEGDEEEEEVEKMSKKKDEDGDGKEDEEKANTYM